MEPHKIAHHIFEVMQKSHIWIEGHDDHYALLTKSDLAPATQVIGVFDSLIHARASLDATLIMLAPNIIEGSIQDVSEFDKR